MFDHINHWLRTLPEKLRQLPPLQRFALLGAPAALLAAVVVMVTLWGGGEKEQQQVLYSQLNMQDAGAIAAKLKEMKTWTDHLGRTKLRTFTDKEGHFWLEQNAAKHRSGANWQGKVTRSLGSSLI